MMVASLLSLSPQPRLPRSRQSAKGINVDTETQQPPKRSLKQGSDWVVTSTTIGILSAFVIASLISPSAVGRMVNTGFTFSARTFGFYWQVLLFFTFVFAFIVMLTPWAKAYLGHVKKPEFDRFKWVAMIMCTLLAGGGVFWAGAEPMFHYLNTPPTLTSHVSDEFSRATVGLTQSFVHWGFLAWAILGTTGAVVLTYAHEQGMPMRPRTLLYPLGKRVVNSWVGTLADIVAIVAVVAGTVGPIGFLGLQVSYGLSVFFGWPNTYPLQLGVIAVLVITAAISVLSGLDKGIQILSRLNVWMAVILMTIVIALGSVVYLVQHYFSAFTMYITTFVGTSLHLGDAEWMGGWTIFFFGWFLGYAPLMSIFIARISRGRTVRDLFFTVAILAPIVTTFWFTVMGGTAIMFEQKNAGSISEPLAEGGLPSAVIAMSQQLPAGSFIGGAFLLLTLTFVSTTADSMSYAVAQSCTPHGQPERWLRALWAVLMGVASAVLISIGDGGISALQSFIVITAVPVGFLMAPVLIGMPIYVYRMSQEQKIRPPLDKVPDITDEDYDFGIPIGWQVPLTLPSPLPVLHKSQRKFPDYKHDKQDVSR